MVNGLSGAAVLLFPKSLQLLAGNIEAVGTGFVVSLTLVFGSLMFSPGSPAPAIAAAAERGVVADGDPKQFG